MADLKNLMLEELRKSSLIQTSSIDETEEFLDIPCPVSRDKQFRATHKLAEHISICIIANGHGNTESL